MAKLEGGSVDQMAKLEDGSVDEAMGEWHERGVGTRPFDALTVAGLRVDAIEPGRALFSFTVPARLTEEIEIEAKVLSIGEMIGCVTVEVRRKATSEVLAHGRHTKYLATIASKM
ncbi:hypothetical protein ACQ4PT_003782 [Festuca glaucescens]